MRTIYLVRHGETLFNVHHKIQGTCDSPLTRLGQAQARAVRDYFLNRGIKFNAAFTSKQERASDTLEIITDKQISYLRLNNLHEKSHGEYEGQDEFMLPWRRGFSRINAAMEPDEKVTERMQKAMTEILDKTKSNDTILVVGHGTALRLYTQTINPHFGNYDNCGVVKLIDQNGKLQFINYVNPAKNVKLMPIKKSAMLFVR